MTGDTMALPADRARSERASVMRAVGLHRYGDPDVLEVVELPVPVAGPDDVLVRVAAATVNPTDLLFRSGLQASGVAAPAPPYVPGMELAGTVADVGERVRTTFPDLSLGRRVIGVVDPRRAEGGAQAEYVALPAASVVPISFTDLAEAATVPMNGLTALIAVEALTAARAHTVLVTGGAGAVGGYVVEMARHEGLHVIADAGEADAALLERLGAAEVVPRGAEMPAAVRDRHPDGIDAVVDAARLGMVATGLVRDGGTAVLLRHGDEQDQRLHSHVVSVSTRATDTVALRRLDNLVAAGRLTPRVALTLPMTGAAQAHRLVAAGGLRGRVVLNLSAEISSERA